MKKCFAIILSIIMLFTGLSPVFGAQTDGAGQSDHYVLKDGINTYTGVTFWLDANGEYYVSTATSYENRKTCTQSYRTFSSHPDSVRVCFCCVRRSESGLCRPAPETVGQKIHRGHHRNDGGI